MANFEQRGHTVRALVRMKGQRTSATFDSEKAAREWARRTEKRIKDGEIIRKFDDSADPSVAYVLERYAREVSPFKRSAKSEQIVLHAMVRKYPEVFNVRCSEFRTDNVEAYVTKRAAGKNRFGRKNSSRTVTRDIAVLSTAFTYAIRRWKMPFHEQLNPVHGIQNRPKETPPRKRRVSVEEVKLLCAHLGYVEGTAPQTNKEWVAWSFLFSLATAMRKGEVLRATWEHVYADELYIHLPETKNGEERDVALSPRALELLACLKPGKGAARVVPVSYDNVNNIFLRAKKALGIVDLHYHDSRHEATTQFAAKVPNTLELAAITGHKSLKMLQRYFNPTATETALKLREASRQTAPATAPVLQQDPKAWKAGYRAGLLGKPVTTCPYASSSMEAWSWMSGYLEGSAEQAANDAA